ncbi:MAG: N-acetylglucosamine kinase [Candidatus Hydrogenedentota bacterium]
MKYFLGLDAGGTKTFCLIADETGRVLGFGKAGCGNYEGLGIPPARVENQKAVTNALKSAGLEITAITAVGMGIAGADLPEDYEMLDREIFKGIFGDIPRDFQNDSMAGLRGGIRHPYGIVIACGTGCVCAGMNQQHQHARTGGLGGEFGDFCSGTDLGRRGLIRVWQSRDGVFPPTRMTPKFVARGECKDVDELFYKVYRKQITESDLQPMAKLVFEAAAEGDEAACAILEEGGRYLGEMVNATARKLSMQGDSFEVVMAGSVFKGSSPVLKDSMVTVIHRECPHARTVMPVFEPVVGALLMGMEVDGPVSDAVYTRLAQALEQAESQYSVKLKVS